MKVCVFCSSSNRIALEYKEMAREFANRLAENGHSLVYGGSTGGLMDSIAEGATEKQGEIIGIIPKIIIGANRESKLPTRQIITADMSERKKRLKEEAELFVVLPGGYGTLDEMFDVIASATVGEHKKPLICLNYQGFYNELIQFSEKLKRDGFMPEDEVYKPIFVDTVEECLQIIQSKAGKL